MTRNKLFLTTIAALACAFASSAQTKPQDKTPEPDYQFTTIKEIPVTPVKNQYRSGTCWCFSTLSFLEAELIRTQGKQYDLSEMWVVGHSYSDRARRYVRMDGHIGFSAGSGCGDVFEVVRRYGIVPESIYSGMQYGSDKPEQAEMDAVLHAYVKAVASRPGKTLTTAWKKGYDAVVQAYLGAWPAEFQYEGRTITPQTYRDEVLKMNVDDYVNICSFIDEPLYQVVPIEVCDNWRNAGGWNVTMDDMLRIMYNALDSGYTVLWGGDVSEKGFTRNGLAVMSVPDDKKKDTEGTDQAHWTGKDNGKDSPDSASVKKPELPAEVEVNDSLRQSAYDRKLTTDDHGMHIYGYATDQNGTKYFKVKNSWGEAGKYKGIWYMSETFIAYKTLNFIVHKDALPKDIRKKLGIK